MLLHLICGLLTTLTPSQPEPTQQGGLKIVNPRATFGRLGATRPKEGAVPGETFHFAFEIEGMQENTKGEVYYTLTMEVFNSKKKKVFQLGPQNRVAVNFLSGKTMPCLASMSLPLVCDPGIHTLVVTVVDRKSKKKVVFQSQGLVKPLTFSFVRVGTYANPQATVPMPPIGVVGQTMTVKFGIVGFNRDKKTEQPNIEIFRTILDSKGKSIRPKVSLGTINKGVFEEQQSITPSFTFTLSNEGKYTIVVTGEDKVAGKSTTVRLPIQVIRLKGLQSEQ